MTGTSISSANLDPRRRRALYQAWHRGMREMDILIGKFADAHIAVLSEEELSALEALMNVPDRDLLAWFTGEHPVTPDFDTPLWRKLVAFHRHDGPIHV